MVLLILITFLAGVVTVFSPCVLPVLPILLSTSTGGGRWRPLSIVMGFIAVFTTITLIFTAAAEALALPHQWLRIIAIVALGAFGLVLLVPALGRAFERLMSPLARMAGKNSNGSGLGGGLLLGAGLGFVWAPCVGPIMASVIVLTATQGISAESVALTLAYGLGAGVPMLAIAYGARGIVARAKKLGPRSVLIQRAFGGLAVLACAALLFGWDARLQTFALRNLPPEWNTALISIEQSAAVDKELAAIENKSTLPAETMPTVQPTSRPASAPEPTIAAPTPEPTVPPTPKPLIALEDRGVAPELVGLTEWINSDPLTLEQLRGKVVIIDFWTFGCYNCRNTRPHVRALYDKYHEQGLEILGIHAPEFAYEKVPDNVRAATKEQGVNWPVALDPDFKTWRAYSNRYWPAFYFIDANGHLRYSHFGEGNYEKNDLVVQQLLREGKASAK
jgi:cytochrome c biogenesis protein CcdA/thiol-disulfide isomerase/thioredoxin